MEAGDLVTLVSAETALDEARECLLCADSLAREETTYAEFKLTANSPATGYHIRELNLPRESLVVSVRRNAETHVAHGSTLLQIGDTLVVYAEQDDMIEVEHILLGTSQSVEG